jgi:hypothetical protein
MICNICGDIMFLLKLCEYNELEYFEIFECVKCKNTKYILRKYINYREW